jgi:LCP family protein required for cell wall assembly
MLAGFVIPKVMLLYYGSEMNGLVSSINQFISYFNLVEAGLAGAAVYALYKPLAENNYEEINHVVSATKKFYIQAGNAFVVLLISLAALYPIIIKKGNLSGVIIGVFVLILGAKGVLEFYTLAKYRVLLTADQKTYVISIASSVYTILNMIIIYCLGRARVSILLLYAVSLLAVFARTLILMIYVKVKYPAIDYNAEPDKKALNKRWDALTLQILGVVQNGAPAILATFFLNLTTVSIYAVYTMVITGINGVLSIFNSGLSSSFGDVIAKKEDDILKKAYGEFEFAYYMIITIIYSIAFVMITPFIKVYTSGIKDADYIQPMIGFFVVLNGYLSSIKTPQGMLVISAGHYKETKYQTLAQALILIIAGLILVKPLGLIGILIGACLSNLYRDADLMLYVPKKIVNITWIRSFKRIVWSVFSVMVIYIIFQGRLTQYVHSYVSWIVVSFLIGIAATVIVLASAMMIDRKQMGGIAKRIIHIRYRKPMAKVIKIAVLGIAAIIAAAGITAYAVLHSYLNKINLVTVDQQPSPPIAEEAVPEYEDLEVEAAPCPAAADSIDSSGEEITAMEDKIRKNMEANQIPILQDEDVFNVLLIGSDTRTSGGNGRSDAMIVVSINKRTKTITATSILRDIYLQIPGKKNNRINAAYALGGADLLMDTIEQNFKMPIDRYASVDFFAFVDIVDAVGGVTIEVTEKEIPVINRYVAEMNQLTGVEESLDQLTTPGIQTLNGKQALGYARNRYVGNNDFERTARQRRVLEQIFTGAKDLNIIELNNLMKKILPQVTTNLKKGEIFSLILSMPSYIGYDLQQWSIPVQGSYSNMRIHGAAVLGIDFDKNIDEIIKRIYKTEPETASQVQTK